VIVAGSFTEKPTRTKLPESRPERVNSPPLKSDVPIFVILLYAESALNEFEKK
jgi:hypothetical protein